MKNKRNLIIFHVSFWVLNYLYGLLFWSEVSSNARLFFIIPFYINYFILVPYFFRKGAFWSLGLWFLLIWGVMSGIHAAYYYGYYFLNNKLEELERARYMWIGGYICFYYIAISTGSRLAMDWKRNKRIMHELLLKKTNTQIQSIRTNVNIPFVLETLTTMEREALKSPESIQQPILELSNLLRYGLYDTQSIQVPLEKEIDAIRNYLWLVNHNQTDFSLSLRIMRNEDEWLVPPNIMVKFISIWIDFYQHLFSGPYEIGIDTSGDNLTLTVPMSDSFSTFREVLEEKLKWSDQEGFEISCQEFNDGVILSIKHSKDEN